MYVSGVHYGMYDATLTLLISWKVAVCSSVASGVAM